MALQFDARGRPIYYDVGGTYNQDSFNELLRGLAGQESLQSIDIDAIQRAQAAQRAYDQARNAMGDNPMSYADEQAYWNAVGGRDVESQRAFNALVNDYQQRTDPQTGETYYTRRLMSGGPGDRDNTFSLDPSFQLAGGGNPRANQDWFLQGIYNADGTLREIAPEERLNTSSWVEMRDALKPVAIMAALAAGGGWLAQAQAAAQAGAGAGGLAAAPGALDAAGFLASNAGIDMGFLGAAGGLGAAGAAAAGGAAAGGAGTAAATAGGAATVGSLLSNPAVIGGGLSLVGGALGADAASDAAEMQQQSANAAIEEVRRQYDQNRADQMPWLQAGQTSLADLMGQMPALTQAYTQADFQNDPGYQFELAEGQRALDAAARARGLYGSSGSLRELLRYSQGLASTRYQDAWNRDLTNRQNTYNMLSGISGTGQVTAGNLGSMGQNTANTVGDLLTQTGNARAAGRVGSANAWTQAGSNALNAWQQQMLIDKIGSNLYR